MNVGKSSLLRQFEMRKSHVRSIVLLGREGGDAKNLAEIPILVPGQDTARIQEAHRLPRRTFCELAEMSLWSKEIEKIVIADSDQLASSCFIQDILASLVGVCFGWIYPSSDDGPHGIVEEHLSATSGLVVLD